MGSFCDVVEMENRKVDEYFRCLFYVLEERVKLE